MPYKDKQKQLEYQRKWIALRKAKWLEHKTCSICNSVTDLRIDHINPAEKVSHRIWSWSIVRREEELAKCQVLCNSCHKIKTLSNKEYASGVNHGKAKFTEEEIKDIRTKYETGLYTMDEVGQPYGIDKRYVWWIVHHKVWKDI